MGKRSADGVERPGPPLAGPPTEAARESAPRDLLYLDCSSIVSQSFCATHIGSDGTVVFQSPTEIVVANLEDGSVRGRYDPLEMFVHGVLEDGDGRAAVCLSSGDDITAMSVTEAPEAIYTRTMPLQVQKGRVAVVNSMIFVIKENAVAIICPFLEREMLWISPAPISNLISDRGMIPTIVTGIEPHLELWALRPEAMEVSQIRSTLEMPLSTIAADAALGVGVVAVFPDTGLLSISPAYPAFSDIPLLVSPVSASWTDQTVYVLGSASGLGGFPAVYALMPSLGMITGIFHPNKTRLGGGAEPAPETDCIRGKFVLWQGQPYILAALW